MRRYIIVIGILLLGMMIDAKYIGPCSTCGGYGKVRCAACNGTGGISGGYYDMYGNWWPTIYPCAACGSTGGIRCFTCGGSGRYVEQDASSSSSGSSSGGGNVYIPPTSGSSGNSSGSSSSSTRRQCPGCDGSGKGADQITYAPEYTGTSSNVYCSTCGRTTSRHSHHRPLCRVCNGRGYVN